MRPLLVGTGETDCTRLYRFRGSVRHLRLPSFQPALMLRARLARLSTDWTPGTLRKRQVNSSWALSTS